MTLISLGVDYGNTGYEEFMSKKIHTCSNSALVAVFEHYKKKHFTEAVPLKTS